MSKDQCSISNINLINLLSCCCCSLCCWEAIGILSRLLHLVIHRIQPCCAQPQPGTTSFNGT